MGCSSGFEDCRHRGRRHVKYVERLTEELTVEAQAPCWHAVRDLRQGQTVHFPPALAGELDLLAEFEKLPDLIRAQRFGVLHFRLAFRRGTPPPPPPFSGLSRIGQFFCFTDS